MIVWSHTKCALLNILSVDSERVEIERPCLTYLCVKCMHLSSRCTDIFINVEYGFLQNFAQMLCP